MKKKRIAMTVLELSRHIVQLLWSVEYAKWMFWHELWVEWPYSQNNLCIAGIAERLKAHWRTDFLDFNKKIWVISALVFALTFCLECSSLLGNTKTCFSDKLLYSLFFPLKFELNREREREIDFCFVLIFVLGKALTHNTRKATQAVSHKASTWCSCFWRDDSCFL